MVPQRCKGETTAAIQFYLPNVFSMYAASSADALGTMPGSLNAVRSNVDMTKINNQAAINGAAGETFSYKYGQLQEKKTEKSFRYMYASTTPYK